MVYTKLYKTHVEWFVFVAIVCCVMNELDYSREQRHKEDDKEEEEL